MREKNAHAKRRRGRERGAFWGRKPFFFYCFLFFFFFTPKSVKIPYKTDLRFQRVLTLNGFFHFFLSSPRVGDITAHNGYSRARARHISLYLCSCGCCFFSNFFLRLSQYEYFERY